MTPNATPAPTVSDHDPVDHPRHYCLPSGLECIDVIEALGLPFHLANAFKYLWRAGRKLDEVEDVRKAIWYLQRWVDRHEEVAAEEEVFRPVRSIYAYSHIDAPGIPVAPTGASERMDGMPLSGDRVTSIYPR